MTTSVERSYRRDRWADQPEWVEIWSEKGTVRGTIAPVLHVCRMHGGAAPQVEAKAKERFSALLPKALSRLDALLDRSEFPTVQFQAARLVIEQEVGKPTERVKLA